MGVNRYHLIRILIRITDPRNYPKRKVETIHTYNVGRIIDELNIKLSKESYNMDLILWYKIENEALVSSTRKNFLHHLEGMKRLATIFFKTSINLFFSLRTIKYGDNYTLI